MVEFTTSEMLDDEYRNLLKNHHWSWDQLGRVLWLAPLAETEYIPVESAPDSIQLDQTIINRGNAIYQESLRRRVELLARLEMKNSQIEIAPTISIGERHTVTDLSESGEIKVGDFHTHLDTQGGFSTFDYLASERQQLSLLQDQDGLYLLVKTDTQPAKYEETFDKELRSIAAQLGVPVNDQGRVLTRDERVLLQMDREANRRLPAKLGFVLYREVKVGLMQQVQI